MDRSALQPFFSHGVKKVVVSAPVKDADPVLNIVYGCNEVREIQIWMPVQGFLLFKKSAGN
jgi:glyceraldehyde-3-phosphate dehydrogenase/erythrose-4-phosphate dehydrogenase